MPLDYKELATLYHMDTSPDRDAHAKVELTSRLQADSTFRIGYQAKEGELFIATPRELSILDERVLRTERKVSRLMRSIPGIAQSAMLRGLVLDEVISTNAIESIHSTRRQIKNALESSTGSSTSQRKFRELARLYMDIIDGNSELPQTPADIRAIYDRGMDAEISNRDKPDGILFRAGGVDISNGMKTLHKGLEPEEKIAEAIEAMLKLAASEEIPSVYSAIASHYLFEYAHPFYDGNGRTGRYLLALYLSIPLSMATSLSLSRTIYENKKVYYRAFETAQNPLNRGELTHFVYSILELINIAQGNMATRLESARGGLDTLRGKLRDIASAEALESKERDALFMLMQYEMFGFFGDASLGEISAHLQRGEQRTRQYMKSLEEKGLVKRIRKRNPVTFALTDSFKQRYAIAPLETESAALNAAQGSE